MALHNMDYAPYVGLVGSQVGAPPPRADVLTFWREKKVSEQEFRRPHHNHLTSINAEIDRRDDGNVLIAPRFLGNQRAKIRWGLLTPSRRGVQI